MIEKTAASATVEIFLAGPIEVAKQIIRRECMARGLCVTIEPTLYIYTGGEETGYRVALRNYPRFPVSVQDLEARARELFHVLLDETHQNSGMIQGPVETVWFSRRPEDQK